MKLLTIMVTLMFVIGSNQLEHLPPDVSAKNRQTCIQQSGVDAALVDKFVKGDISNDEKLKCYFKCGFILAKRMEEDGDLIPGAFDTIVPSYVSLDLTKDEVDKCTTLKGGNPCDDAYVIAKCLKEASL